MNLLAFDTATEQMSVALAIGDDVLAVDRPGGALASTVLIPTILALLADAGVRIRDLDAIAFGRGPGAFTGLRTACAVAQGLAYGAGKLVLPIDSLQAVAEVARGERVDFCVWSLLDARMNQIYAGRYRRDAGGWRQLDAPMLTTVDALNQRWRDQAPEAIAGNALSAFSGRLETQDALLVADAMPQAAAMLALARVAWLAGAALDPALALPLYLRDKVAETTIERDLARAARAAELVEAVEAVGAVGQTIETAGGRR